MYGNWYVGEYFSYIRIWGSNVVHFLPRIVPDRMVLQEFSYQTMIDGSFSKLTKHKRKAWPKFPMNLGNLTVQNIVHASLLGKEICFMSLGEASKRMHDPVAYLANLFVHEHVKFQYVHQNEPDDSIFREAITFHEAIDKITEPKINSHMYLFQNHLKKRTLREREDKLEIKQDLEKEKREEEMREHVARSVVDVVAQPKNKGRGVIESPWSPSLTIMEDMSEKGVEIKRNFEKVGSQLQTQEELTEVNPKRLKIVVGSKHSQLP